MKRGRVSKRKCVGLTKPQPEKRLRDLKAKRKHLNESIASEAELLRQMKEIDIKSRNASPQKQRPPVDENSPFKASITHKIETLFKDIDTANKDEIIDDE